MSINGVSAQRGELCACIFVVQVCRAQEIVNYTEYINYLHTGEARWCCNNNTQKKDFHQIRPQLRIQGNYRFFLMDYKQGTAATGLLFRHSPNAKVFQRSQQIKSTTNKDKKMF